MLANTPFVLDMSAYGIGAVFFGWGVAVAVSSVLLAPPLQRRFGSVRTTYAALGILFLCQTEIAVSAPTGIVGFTVATGLAIGVNNTVFTESAMEVSGAPRAVTFAGYNFVRWQGAALAPYIASRLGEAVSPSLPHYVGAASCGAAVLVLASRRRHLTTLDKVGADRELQNATVTA